MPTEAGKAAKAYLESLLGASIELFVATRKMTRKPKKKTDKYGRYLAVLYDNYHDVEADVDETKINMMPASINFAMVSAGHAKERYW